MHTLTLVPYFASRVKWQELIFGAGCPMWSVVERPPLVCCCLERENIHTHTHTQRERERECVCVCEREREREICSTHTHTILEGTCTLAVDAHLASFFALQGVTMFTALCGLGSTLSVNLWVSDLSANMVWWLRIWGMVVEGMAGRMLSAPTDDDYPPNISWLRDWWSSCLFLCESMTPHCCIFFSLGGM